MLQVPSSVREIAPWHRRQLCTLGASRNASRVNGPRPCQSLQTFNAEQPGFKPWPKQRTVQSPVCYSDFQQGPAKQPDGYTDWFRINFSYLKIISMFLKICWTSAYYIRSQIFTAVTMKNAVFLDVTPCDSSKNRRFRGTRLLHHQDDKNHTLFLTNRFLSPWWWSRNVGFTRATRRNTPEDGILHHRNNIQEGLLTI
jgi:hypothetical protein